MPDATEPERATACGLLLREGRLLLERRPATARVYPGLWDTPGGHLEPGEAPEAAFLREMGEELGIRPTGFRRRKKAPTVRIENNPVSPPSPTSIPSTSKSASAPIRVNTI